MKFSIIGLGILHAFFMVIRIFIFIFEWLPVIHHQRWKDELQESIEDDIEEISRVDKHKLNKRYSVVISGKEVEMEDLNKPKYNKVMYNSKATSLDTMETRKLHILTLLSKESYFPIVSYYMYSIIYVFQDPAFIWLLVHLLFSILGVTVTPFFFAYHLFEICSKSKHLRLIATAFKTTYLPIFWTCALLVIVIYIFTIPGYIGLQNMYNARYWACNKGVVYCFAGNLHVGITAAGNMNQFMANTPPQFTWQNSETTLLIISNVIFFIVVGPLLLNIIFALIIETFGELRDKRNQYREDLQHRCFICSIDDSQFQRFAAEKGKKNNYQRYTDVFGDHLQFDHNKWNYLYYFIYIKERAQNYLLSPQEQYFYEKIAAGDYISVFPIERALVLEEGQDEEERQHIAAKLDKLEEGLLELQVHFDKLSLTAKAKGI